MSCCCVFAERSGLSDPKKLEAIETKVVNALRDHCTYNQVAQRKGGQKYFAQITELVGAPAPNHKSVLGTLGALGLQRIMAIRPLESLVPMPPLIEKLFLGANFEF